MGGVGIQEVSAGLSNNPSRSGRDGSVSVAASVAICFGFDLFVSENPGRADQRRCPAARQKASRSQGPREAKMGAGLLQSGMQACNRSACPCQNHREKYIEPAWWCETSLLLLGVRPSCRPQPPGAKRRAAWRGGREGDGQSEAFGIKQLVSNMILGSKEVFFCLV
jgi:hypothetical protein